MVKIFTLTVTDTASNRRPWKLTLLVDNEENKEILSREMFLSRLSHPVHVMCQRCSLLHPV